MKICKGKTIIQFNCCEVDFGGAQLIVKAMMVVEDTPASQGHSLDTSPSSTSYSSLLAALSCQGNIHLIIGAQSLSSARCIQSLNAGARPILLAPSDATLHPALQRKIDDGVVMWERKVFEDEDLFRLGREEVNRVVDAVFVTTGPRDPISKAHKYWPRAPT